MCLGFVIELNIMRLNPKVVGLVVGATVSEGSSTGAGQRYGCPFSIPDELKVAGLTEEVVQPENRAKIITSLIILVDRPEDTADELIHAKEACAKQAEGVISRVGYPGPESGSLEGAIKFALDNPLTVRVCTSSTGWERRARSAIESKIRNDDPKLQDQSVKRLLALKAGGYTDDGCARPDSQEPDPECANFSDEVTKAVALAKLCAALECRAMDGESTMKDSREEFIRSAIDLVSKSPPGRCSQELAYPKLASLLGSAGANAIHRDRALRRLRAERGVAAGHDTRNPQPRDTSAGAVGMGIGLATVGGADLATSSLSCIPS